MITVYLIASFLAAKPVVMDNYPHTFQPGCAAALMMRTDVKAMDLRCMPKKVTPEQFAQMLKELHT